MSGYDVSSREVYSGSVALRVDLALGSGPAAVTLVESRIRAFLDGLAAGFFFPGRLTSAAPEVRRLDLRALEVALMVVDLPTTAFDVVGGMLSDCRHHDVSLRSAVARLDGEVRKLLFERHARPRAVGMPPFAVALPSEVDGSDPLLVEIEFVAEVPIDERATLLGELALWEILALAYPSDPDEGAEVGEAQRHFNDPRTIHHYEWYWDADPAAWNLLINLCCAWSSKHQVARLHVE